MCLLRNLHKYAFIDRDGQTMLWVIFHVFPIKLKFQWTILSKFNISISVVNVPFFCWMRLWPMAPQYSSHWCIGILLWPMAPQHSSHWCIGILLWPIAPQYYSHWCIGILLWPMAPQYSSHWCIGILAKVADRYLTQ